MAIPEGVRLKTERAKHHIGELDEACNLFLKSDPYKVRPHDEPKTGDQLFRLHVLKEPPIWWSLLIGDAIHNLRAALDLLVYQLIELGGGSHDESKGFPVFDERPSQYESAILSHVKGSPKKAVKLLRGIQPYQGGDGHRLWQLHRLDIIDKHRLLIPVFGSYEAFFPDWKALLGPAFKLAGEIDLGLRPEFRCPVEDGMDLARVPAAERAKGDHNPKFKLSVAINEPEVLKCEPVVPFLKESADLVERAIEPFAPFFSDPVAVHRSPPAKPADGISVKTVGAGVLKRVPKPKAWKKRNRRKRG